MGSHISLSATTTLHVVAHFSGRGAGSVGLPTWTVTYLVVTTLVGVVLWTRTRFVGAARDTDETRVSPTVRTDVSRPARPWQTAGQITSAAALLIVIFVAFTGGDTLGTNIAPIAVMGVWWTLGGWPAILAGPIWQATDPFHLAARVRGDRPGRGQTYAPWVALGVSAAFVVVWVIWPEGDEPRRLGIWLVTSVVGFTALAATCGPDTLQKANPLPRILDFASWIIPTRARGRPMSDAAMQRTTFLLAALVSGAVATDRMGFSGWYTDAFADAGTATVVAVNTWLVACCTLGFAGIWWLVFLPARRLASGRAGRATGTPAGIIAFGAMTAGVLLASGLMTGLVQTQNFLVLASDPFSRGWNLFGTITWQITQDPISPRTAGLVQVGVLTAAHGAALVHLARELTSGIPTPSTARERRRRWRSGLPAMACIMASCIVWTLLLLGG